MVTKTENKEKQYRKPKTKFIFEFINTAFQVSKQKH